MAWAVEWKVLDMGAVRSGHAQGIAGRVCGAVPNSKTSKWPRCRACACRGGHGRSRWAQSSACPQGPAEQFPEEGAREEADSGPSYPVSGRTCRCPASLALPGERISLGLALPCPQACTMSDVSRHLAPPHCNL